MVSRGLCLMALCLGVLYVNLEMAEGRAAQTFRSDSIQTKFEDDRENEPGWMKRKLANIGELFGKVGNGLGATGMKVTGYIDRLCKLLKAVIPVVATVCHVGQFKFCASVDAPMELADAISAKDADLNLPD